MIRNYSKINRVKKPEIGEVKGNWTIIKSEVNEKKPYHILVECICGKKRNISYQSFTNSRLSEKCVKCSNKDKIVVSNNETKENKIRLRFFKSIKRGAKKRDLLFSVSIDEIWEIFLKQEQKCALSGIKIGFDIENAAYKNGILTTASLDRIDSSKGYTRDNVQWVHKKINVMKMDLSEDQFIELCNAVSTKYKNIPRTKIIARLSVEGIHRWENCPIEEVSYLRNYHRHIFFIIVKTFVYHNDRDIEFIELTHKIKNYLRQEYFSEKYQCLFFDGKSCEMIADELVQKFNLYECEVNEDNESGAVVKAY